MPRVIIDTNIIVSAFIKRVSASAVLLKHWREGKFILIVSREILAKIYHVLLRPRIVALTKMTTGEIAELIALISEEAEIISPDKTAISSRDFKDNIFLEAAVTGRADFLVTGDRDLLVLKKINRTQIVTLRDFLGKI